MSVRGPKRGTGTESPVGARKARSGGWSEGVAASGFLQGSTRAGRSLMEQAKPFSISKRKGLGGVYTRQSQPGRGWCRWLIDRGV
jgi:hypothetical protein